MEGIGEEGFGYERRIPVMFLFLCQKLDLSLFVSDFPLFNYSSPYLLLYIWSQMTRVFKVPETFLLFLLPPIIRFLAEERTLITEPN